MHFKQFPIYSSQWWAHWLVCSSTWDKTGMPFVSLSFCCSNWWTVYIFTTWTSRTNLAGVTLRPGCPPIHLLLFAYDLILCGKATEQEAATIKTILNRFYNASGQVPNLQKSYILFSKSVDSITRSIIKSIFPVPDLQPHTKHLGHPIIFNHNDHNRAYNFILN